MGELTNLMLAEAVPVAAERLPALEEYARLLSEWNRRMDLTSVQDADAPSRHFLDSLLPLKETGYFFPGAKLIDVGTGAGFPGLAIAVARPDMQITLLEAQGKRCAFLNAVKDALALDNVLVANDRAEVLGRSDAHRERYDLAVARAVAAMNVLLEYLLPFVKPGGYALCWKGPALRDEWKDGAAAAKKLGGEAREPAVLRSPALAGERLLAPVYKAYPIAPQFPRKNGMPAKRPLKSDET